MSKKALEGIKVIDLSRVIAGPNCTMILGDLGAEIIKIEKKGEGDISRGYEPFYKGESTYFMTYNRNKKSVTLDFRHEKAVEVLEKLIVNADVLVENFKAGTLEKMGLSPERLLELNPRIVITRISGFGQTGPYMNRACFDAVAQSLSGLMDITGEPKGNPVMVGTYVCDLMAGVYAAVGTLAALNSRNSTCKGQVVDVALLDAASAMTHSAILNYFMLGLVMERNGNQDRAAWPANFYTTRDGRMVFIHAGQDPAFANLCKILGREDLLENDEYKFLSNRKKHIDECDTLVRSWTMQNDLEFILETCEKSGLPCAPVNSIEEMIHNEQLISRQMIRDVEDDKFGTIKASGPVIKMSDTNPDVYRHAPRLGEDNLEVYMKELCITRVEYEELVSSGAI